MALIPPPKKKEAEAPAPVVEEGPVVNLDDAGSRMEFLKNQLNDMLDGINDNYGQELMEELLKRLEHTVEDFNSQVTDLIARLKAGKIFQDDDEEETQGTAFSGDTLAEEQAAAQVENEDTDIVKRMMARAGKADAE